jgi:NAD dependent epimerase/dehydratase
VKWENRSVLITGAGGFIGSHLAERLVQKGSKTRCFVRYTSRNDWGFIDHLPPEIKDKMDVIPGDLRDPEAVHRATEGVDIVFHLGALISIPYSYIHPRESIETNVLGTLNMLLAAKEHDVRKIIHTSTSEVYGTARYVPIDENHPLQGQSPYAASKIGADKIAESFHRTYGLPIAIIRPFNTYGPRQSARAVIPAIITQALTKNKVLLGALHPTRDYTYVDDVVDAFIKLAETPKSVGEVINIGSNFEISIRELAKKILSLMNKKAKIVSEVKRIRPEDSEVERLWCNNTKAKKLLGWKPKTPLEEGLKKTIEWTKNNLHLYKPEIYTI